MIEYLHATMHQATYEILPDGTFYGEIPSFQGVYSNSESLEDCRQQLQEVLEGWLILGLQLGHQLPVVEGIDLAGC